MLNDGLKLAQEAVQERLKAGLKGYADPIEKHLQDPLSKAKAIKAKCFDCVGRGWDPNWKKAVGNCSCLDCPLYTVRPYQKYKTD